jgi:hypothetical protein
MKKYNVINAVITKMRTGNFQICRFNSILDMRTHNKSKWNTLIILPSKRENLALANQLVFFQQ